MAKYIPVMTKKKHIYTISIYLFLILGISFLHWHKFYVSLTEINFLPDKNTIEVSMRIFPDDLDRALEEIVGKNPNIATEIENPKADIWFEAYLHANFSLEVNGTELPYKYLGKVNESNAIWCFLEINSKLTPHKIKVSNSILTEIFEDQKNIIQINYNNEIKGLLLDRIQRCDSIIIEN